MSETIKPKRKKTAKIKTGVVNLGNEFEKLVPAYFALRLLNKEKVESFKLTLNPSSFSKFDDLLVEVHYKNKKLEKFAIQLKHRQSGRDKLDASEEFTGIKSDKQTKNFNISGYIEGFHKLNKELQNDYKCILYTNSKFQNIHEQKVYAVCEANSVLNSGKVHQLSDHRSNENAEFFKNFLLFSEQKNVEQLKDSIIDTFVRFYKAHEQTATCYIDFFGEVRKQNYADTELTRDQTILKIMDLLLSKHVLKVQLPEDELRYGLIEQSIKKFDLSVVPKVCKNLIENCQRCITQNDINHLKALKAVAEKTSELNDNQNFLVFCQLGRKPLFIYVHKNCKDSIYQGIRLSKMLGNIRIHIVLVDKKFNKENWENFDVLQNLADLKNLNGLYKQLATKIKISLQGRTMQSIQTFTDFGIYLDKFVTLSDIIESEVLSIGAKTEELPQPFIERRLLLNVITPKFLSKACKDENVLIHCRNSSEFREILAKENPNFNILEMLTYEVSSKQYRNPVIVLADQKSEKYTDFTQLRVVENNYLQFVKNKPDVNEIFFSHSRLSLICGEPGTGKTTMMKYLAQKCPLSYLIVSITSVEMRNLIQENTVEEGILKHLPNTDIQIVQYFWRKEKIIFMIDGLDELDKKNIDLAIKFIADLKNHRVLIFCREHLRKSMMKKLNLDCIYSIKDLSLEDQKVYIDKVLQKNEEGPNQILDNISKLINLDLLKKPLYLYIFTETLVNCGTFNTIVLTPTRLYSEFLEGKFFHYLKKHKWESLNESLVIMRFKRYCLKEYKIAALQVCLMEQDFKSLRLESDTIFMNEIAENDDLGLISKISTNICVFLHHTVAEYLAALWFSENVFKISKEERKILFNPKYISIKYFFDRILAEDKPLHLAVLEQSYKDVVKFAEQHLNDLDNGGRTALHLVSSNRNSYILENEDEFEFSHFHDLNESQNIIKITKHLLKLNSNPLATDKIFDWNCFQYADASHSLCILELLSKKEPLQWHHLTNLERSLNTKERTRPLLHILIENNYKNIANFFIQNNIGLEAVDGDHESVLHEAAFWGHINIVKLLLKQNINIHLKNKKNQTALQLAARMGHAEIVELLVEEGAQVDTQDTYNRTPLIEASYKGYLNVVKVLIKKGADVNKKNSSGYTPLHHAAKMGHLPVVEYLVENKANIEEVNEYSRTSLHLAAYSGRDNVVQYLVDKGSNIEAQDEDENTPLQIAEKKYINIVDILRRKPETIKRNSTNLSRINENPLHEAARNNDKEKVENLLSTGIDINQFDDRTNTILHIACYEGHEELVKYLLDSGADPNITANKDRCPLHVAALRGHTRIIEILLTNGVLIDPQDNLGQTPLHLAAYKGHFDIVKLLIDTADASLTDNSGTTLFHFAVCGGNIEIMEYLQNKGAKIEAKNDKGETCLIRAVRQHCIEGVKYIAQNCPKILDEVNLLRQTALHCAAEWGYEDVVRIIVQAGADTRLKDDNKFTALDVAEKFERHDVAYFLKSYPS